MRQYHFRPDAVAVLMRNCVFEVHDWGSTSGGGVAHFGRDGAPTRVVMHTAQHEACVHECAHAWWYELERERPARKDPAVAELIAVFRLQSLLEDGGYPVIRQHCRQFRTSMWNEELGRWSHDEIFASLASAVMCDMRRMPVGFHGVYGEMLVMPQ